MNGRLRLPEGESPVELVRQNLLDTSDQLRMVADTMHMSGEMGDTAREMIALGPLVTQLGVALEHLDVWVTARMRMLR